METSVTALDLAHVRYAGPAQAAALAAEALESGGASAFWVNLDADVLASEVMPVVDSPQPDGLSLDEL